MARLAGCKGATSLVYHLLEFLLVNQLWQQAADNKHSSSLFTMAQYDEIAASFNSTVEEILSLGGLPDDVCTFSFNSTVKNCDNLIGTLTLSPQAQESCDCFNFCDGKINGCYKSGEMPPLFACEIRKVVAGCQLNQTEDKVSPLTLNDGTQTPCPPGFMCSKDRERSCEEIRQIPIQLGLGDVHAGMHCPGRPDREENNYQLCPAGFYCPNSTTILPCPRGYFCPHKTAFPDIKCHHCPEAMQTLERQSEGYIIFGLLFGVLVVMVAYIMFKQYNAKAYAHLKELRGRNYDRVVGKIQSGKRQEKLKRLEPKLQIIENRLKRSSGKYKADNRISVKALSTQTQDGRIKFNARRLFNMMDTDGDGELSIEEINHALELNPLQLREFCRRMNQAAKLPPENVTISKDVFIKYFLAVLEQISHFQPSATEADALFDDIMEQYFSDEDGIVHESLFSSALADFLDENQIHNLIKRFRELQQKNYKAMSSDAESGNAARRAGPNNTPGRRVSTGSDGTELPVTRRRNNGIGRHVRRLSLQRSASDDDIRINPLKRILKRSHSIDQAERTAFEKFKRSPITPFVHKFDTISREEWMAWYPSLLMEVTAELTETDSARDIGMGVDIAFENLSLTVTVKRNEIKIVDRVTGRLQAGTMTALMGGSGAGKTSLLNALCGRAFYGQISGIVKINGHQSEIGRHSSAVGFVPQDDIVYEEITVRENFIFSGKFRLPAGTPPEEIEDLADETMANLGLSRVMHSIVGSVNRRGVSGGEKKRVNIGLELMARPKIVFLDEPTSGLDSNSALLVMESLSSLAQTQGTTICSVIHQPRKFIFELFDSLILLGVGGKMVYHGPTSFAEDYFNKLHYNLPAGESIADWLIDISSGRLEPSNAPRLSHSSSKINFKPSLVTTGEDSEPSFTEEEAFIHSERIESSESAELCEQPADDASESNTSMLDLVKSTRFDNASSLVDEAGQAKERREGLYRNWREHFSALSDEEREIYMAPELYDLPVHTKRTTILKQMFYQLQRLSIVSGRNWFSKAIDTVVIVGATCLISILDGTEQLTNDEEPLQDLNFDAVAYPSTVKEMVKEFPLLFRHAISANVGNLQMYAAKLGVLLSVLLALTATKAITSKRKEFFREAASGYSTDAYFIALNIVALIEHSIQVLISGLCSIWLRNSMAAWLPTLVNFLMVGWIAVGWAMFFPLVVPLENVIIVTGFYMVLFSLLFSGAVPPILYLDIYNNTATAVFSGLFSPTRYFVEGLAVVESRVLPVQHGFTDFGVNFNGGILQVSAFQITGLGLNDFGTITVSSSGGWYWSAIPAFFVGLWVRWMAAGLIHISNRSQQCKRPFWTTIDAMGVMILVGYLIVLVGLLAAAVYFMLYQKSKLE